MRQFTTSLKPQSKLNVKEKEKYKIKLVPTIIVEKDGKISRYVGGKSKAQIIEILKKH